MWASSQEVPIGEIDSAEGCSIPERISHGGCLVAVVSSRSRSVMSVVEESPAPRQGRLKESPPKKIQGGQPRSSESLDGRPPPIPPEDCPSTALQWTAFREGHFSWPWRNVDAKVRQSPARIPVHDARRGKEHPAAEVILDKSALRVWSAWSQRNDNATTRNNYSHH